MILYFDCTSGISSDMVLKALIQLGGNTEAAAGLALSHGHHHHDGCEHEEGHDHGHEHEAGEHGAARHYHDDRPHHSHRSHKDIQRIIERSHMPQAVKDRMRSIYRVIAEAEAKVHGSDVENVHFHEVGREEAIANIAGIAAAIESLDVQEICCSELHDGKGFIECSHGRIPVPVPAVMAMRENCDYVFVTEDIETELVTPSGLGILMGLGAKHAENAPAGKIVKTAIAKGGRDTGKEGLRASLIEGE